MEESPITQEVIRANRVIYELIFERNSSTPYDRNELINAIKSFRSHPILSGANLYSIHRIHEDLCRQVNNEYPNLPDINCYSGEFPTHSMNAECRLTTSGYLFLINSGFIYLTHEVSKVMTLLALNASNNINEGYTDRVFAMNLSNLLITYLFLDFNARPRARLEIRSREQYVIFSLVSAACTKFVLAHEFGHALSGHLTSNLVINDQDFIQKNFEEELEADRVGINLLLFHKESIHQDEIDLSNTVSVAAITLLFELDNLLQFLMNDPIIKTLFVNRFEKNNPHFTHPSSTIRMTQMVDLLDSNYPFIDIQLALSLAESFKKYREPVLLNLQEFLIRNSL
ncbi:hypothetical protein [Mucilaginibacter sp. BT774]|uniref:hypothetical protein n=1 Tax=Mucilaginibacter sp. BT774 TaxID=3062276 RepID=UPI002675158A|nr:hypothetical protein [Mucilaginibacter sp. BT774]MDO3627662.1 hypothetical protein [Mucilaginibacter sp. BT774]